MVIYLNILTFEDISIRLLNNTKADKELILSWLLNPTVNKVAWSEGVPWTIEKIEKHFTGKLIDGENISPCIIEYNLLPIGYVQFYPAFRDDYIFIEPVYLEHFTNGYAIDIFIGLPKLWSKGLGRKVIIALKEYLFNEKNAVIIFADPEETNIRSIRCWEKAGFTPIGKIPNYDEPTKISICMMARQ